MFSGHAYNDGKREERHRFNISLHGPCIRRAKGAWRVRYAGRSCGAYPIVQGSSQYTIEGRAVALDRMKTACGASLIASQQEFLASE
ncbi:PAAR domain-containing protein [Burkholderia cenocepacia]|uniref:PAAR domain-containing protein n=1 Tax=Burkholderia cenocepacia TaxID=95486 RepID=UPI002AB7819C|nr:PAAR domain-containing protein [Burkholderia cenocepacia]